MLFRGPVLDNPKIKKQYNPETNAKEKKNENKWAYQTTTEITQSSH